MAILTINYFNNRKVKAAAPNANVQAFLRVIRYAEGTAGANGYRTMFTGRLFDNGYVAHPQIRNCANGYCSTAAGAYQFLTSTWNDLQRKLSLPDFSPASQDLAAIELIRQEGALDDVIAGRFSTAIDKVQNIWASLPDVPGGERAAGYGQPLKTLAELQTQFTTHGGVQTA